MGKEMLLGACEGDFGTCAVHCIGKAGTLLILPAMGGLKTLGSASKLQALAGLWLRMPEG
jgi:hypothetical protein